MLYKVDKPRFFVQPSVGDFSLLTPPEVIWGSQEMAYLAHFNASACNYRRCSWNYIDCAQEINTVYLTTRVIIATSMRTSPEYEFTASLVVSISISESADFARQHKESYSNND